jgi:hypothetical protein
MRNRRLPLAAFLLIAPLFATAAFAADGDFKRTLPASGNAVVSVNSGAGYIHISAGNDDQVSVTGHVRIERRNFHGNPEARLQEILADPPITQEDGKILIGPRDSDHFRNIEIDFDVTVPKGAAVTASTGAGDIRITGIQTVSSVSSGAGNVVIEGVTTGLKVGTGAGSIRVEGHPAADWTIHSGAGNVTLEVGKSASFTLNASSGSGGIHVDVPITLEHTDFGNFQLKGTVNGGGPDVRISTGSGEIRIR